MLTYDITQEMYMVIGSIYVNIYVNVNIFVTHTLALLLDPADSSALTDRLERVALIQDRKLFYCNLLKLTRRCIYSTNYLALGVASFARSSYCLLSPFPCPCLCPAPCPCPWTGVRHRRCHGEFWPPCCLFLSE